MARSRDDHVPILTNDELSWLKDHLRDWNDVAEGRMPISVNDGYGIWYRAGHNSTSVEVGRAKIHEELAKQRLAELGQGRTDGLRGLFYPGATPSFDSLCQAALYFNEFFVIHPGSALFNTWATHDRMRDLSRPDQEAETEYVRGRQLFVRKLLVFDKAVLPLKRAGLLRAIPPQMQERPNFVELITADMGDTEFREIAETGWHNPVYVAAKKMEAPVPLVGHSELGSIQEIAGELNSRLRYAAMISGESGGLFADGYYGVKEVEPVLAASILLNHAFLLSDAHGLVPFTDDSMCLRLMQRKLKRVMELPGFQDFRRTLAIGTASLSLRVLEEYLPRFKFNDVEEILTAREKLAEQLEDFRQAMAALAAEIEESPYDTGFTQRVERTIATRVRPAIAALENEIKTSRDGFITKFIRNTQAGTLPVVGSILAGLPASAVIAISAGVLTFEAAIETYLEISRKKRNGFTLLLGNQ
jgi:hypothetical protein